MAEELIDALVPDQAPVAEGAFTLDLAAAQAKLERYRLADSEYFVLLLVEVGHRLASCTSIEFETGYYSTEVRLVGVELDDESLTRLAEPSVSLNLDALEPRAAALELLARILAGVVVARQFKQIEVGVSGAGRVLRFDSQGAMSAGEALPRRGEARLWISLRERARIWVPWGEAAERLEHRWALVRSRCRYARVPVHIDGERVDGPLPLAEAEVRFPVDEDGAVVAHIGHSLARFEATLILLCHGVVLETLVEPSLGAYRVAEVDVSDLPRDLSMTKLLEGEAFGARLARVRVALRQLPVQGAEPPSFIGDSVLTEVAKNFGLALFSAFTFPLLTPVFVVLGVMFGRQHAKSARLRKVGEPGVALVKSIAWKTVKKEQRPERIVLRVFVAGREPYTVMHEPGPGFEGGAGLFEGARVHVVVDPADPERLEFTFAEGLETQLALPPAGGS